MLRPRDLRDASGTRTFLDAMHGGKVRLARFVLDALDRRIVNTPAGEQGRPPLLFAVCLREAEARARFVRLLLDKGADVNGQDGAGRTALSLACELGYLDAVQLLVQHAADPEIPDRAGNRPLMYAAAGGHSAELRFLLRSYKRFGLRLDATNRAGLSALQAARVSGHRECERALSGPEAGGGRRERPGEAEAAGGGGGCRERGAGGGGSRRERGAGSRREVEAAGGGGRSPKPLSRQMLERFAWPFAHRRGEGDRPQPRGLFGRSSSCSPAHGGREIPEETRPQRPGWWHRSVPEAQVMGGAMLRAHSWEGGEAAGRGGSSHCRRLLRQGHIA
ncbi:hypothetical protein FKM82_016411 [Ascaphus truei]